MYGNLHHTVDMGTYSIMSLEHSKGREALCVCAPPLLHDL